MEEIIRNNIEKHKKLVTQFENNAPQMLIKITMLITDSFKHEGCLYLCGNGGSAADAQHVARKETLTSDSSQCRYFDIDMYWQ